VTSIVVVLLVLYSGNLQTKKGAGGEYFNSTSRITYTSLEPRRAI
jgi:hypothetical protein